MRVLKLSGLLLFTLFCQCSTDGAPTEIPDPPQTNEDTEPEPIPEPIIYFTFAVDDSIDTSELDNWILIHDEAGNLLDYSPYESGETLEFEKLESQLTDNIHVSLFGHRIVFSRDENNQIHEIDDHTGTTYASIPIKEKWTAGKYSSQLEQKTELTSAGEFMLSLSNFSDYDNTLNNYGNLSTVAVPFFGGFSSYNPSTQILDLNNVLDFEENPNYLWTLYNKETLDFKYAFFQDPENELNIELDYNNFKSMDDIHYLPPLPMNNRYFFQHVGFETETSFKSDIGHFILELFGSPDLNGNGLPIGTISKFGFYRTFLNYYTNDYSYFLNQDGPNLEITAFPEPPVLTSSGILNSLEFSSNTSYLRREDHWTGTNTEVTNKNLTSWHVVCNSDFYPQLSELPEDLLNSFPFLVPLDDLEHISSSIYLQGDTYRENLERLFDPNFDHIIKYGFINEYFNISL